MKNYILLSIGLLAMISCSLTKNENSEKTTAAISKTSSLDQTKNKNIKLGAFSLSLSVKDLNVSRQFYESLGFTVSGGNAESNYLIMKNEKSLIGLFNGMFEGNIITFNPGWDENAKNIESFDDVRVIQQQLKSENIELMTAADETTTGPASIMLKDPDGNLILIDQHR